MKIIFDFGRKGAREVKVPKPCCQFCTRKVYTIWPFYKNEKVELYLWPTESNLDKITYVCPLCDTKYVARRT